MSATLVRTPTGQPTEYTATRQEQNGVATARKPKGKAQRHLLLWTIRSILRLHLGSSWLTTQDVFVHFGGHGVSPHGPDIAVIPDARFPAEAMERLRKLENQ